MYREGGGEEGERVGVRKGGGWGWGDLIGPCDTEGVR